MVKRRLKWIIQGIIVMAVLSGCVSREEHDSIVSERDHLLEALAESEERIETLEQELEEARGTSARKEDELAELRQLKDGLREQLEEASENEELRERLEERVAEGEDRIAELEEEIEVVRREKRDLSERILEAVQAEID